MIGGIWTVFLQCRLLGFTQAYWVNLLWERCLTLHNFTLAHQGLGSPGNGRIALNRPALPQKTTVYAGQNRKTTTWRYQRATQTDRGNIWTKGPLGRWQWHRMGLQALWLIHLKASPVDTKQDGWGSVSAHSYWSDYPEDRVQGYCNTWGVAGDDLERRKHTGWVESQVLCMSCVQTSSWPLNCGCVGQTPSSPAEAKELDEDASCHPLQRRQSLELEHNRVTGMLQQTTRHSSRKCNRILSLCSISFANVQGYPKLVNVRHRRTLPLLKRRGHLWTMETDPKMSQMIELVGRHL